VWRIPGLLLASVLLAGCPPTPANSLPPTTDIFIRNLTPTVYAAARENQNGAVDQWTVVPGETTIRLAGTTVVGVLVSLFDSSCTEIYAARARTGARIVVIGRGPIHEISADVENLPDEPPDGELRFDCAHVFSAVWAKSTRAASIVQLRPMDAVDGEPRTYRVGIATGWLGHGEITGPRLYRVFDIGCRLIAEGQLPAGVTGMVIGDERVESVLGPPPSSLGLDEFGSTNNCIEP
jgi:hypothetical protein